MAQASPAWMQVVSMLSPLTHTVELNDQIPKRSSVNAFNAKCHYIEEIDKTKSLIVSNDIAYVQES